MSKPIGLVLLLLLLLSITPATPLATPIKTTIINPLSTKTIDGDPSDWTGTPPGTDNSWTYSNGEWIWKDASGDERTDFGNPDPRVDLTEFRIAGDENYLYILLRFNDTSSFYLGDNGATFVAITIDRDRITGSGELLFGGYSDTSVSSDAAWEYQIIVNLADSRYSGKALKSSTHPLNESTDNWGAIFQLVDKTWSHIYAAGDTGDAGLLAVDLDNNAVEIKISWSYIGGLPDNEYVRFELITARGYSDYGSNQGHTWEIGDESISDALDAMTTTGPNTWDEVSDGVVDYYVDVWFEDGEPVPPPAEILFEDPSPPAGATLYVGDTVTYKVLLRVAGSPASDQAIWVYINDVNETNLGGFTNSSGEYAFTLELTSQHVGSLNVTIYYPGNESLGSSGTSATRLYTVLYRVRFSSFTLNSTTATVGDPVKAYGSIEYYDGTNWQPLANAVVEIVLTNTSTTVAAGRSHADGSFTIVFNASYVGSNLEYKAYHRSNETTGEAWSTAAYLDVQGIIDLTSNINDFPAGSLVYEANDNLTPTGDLQHALSKLYVAWDTYYLYIGVDFAPADWWLALGIGIDVNPGNDTCGYGAVWASNYNTWMDGWQRKVNFSTPHLATDPVYPELEVYFWYDGSSISVAQINRYRYEQYPPVVDAAYNVQHSDVWEYNYATPSYSPVADNHNGSTLFKVAIPWSVIRDLPNITYTGEIAIAVWVTHGEGTSPISVLPMNPSVFDNEGWNELGDTDAIYEFVRIVVDQDLDGTPDTGVTAQERASCYPTYTTTVETDSDYFEVGAGGIITVSSRVFDQYGYYLPEAKIQLIDHNGEVVAEALTGYNDTGFWAVLRANAPTAQGEYNWTVRFVGEAGFQASSKTITLNVTRLTTKIEFTWTYTDNDDNGRVSSGDTITLSITAKYLDPTASEWKPLAGKDLTLTFSYARTGQLDSDTVTTQTDGTASYTYTVRQITGADILTIKIIFAGDDTYAPSQNSTSIEINLARLIDGVNDWGTDLPRSTPGIAPRGDEIVISDPVGDVNSNAEGKIFSDLDIKEVRLTYDGVYLYFYVKFAGPLSRIGDKFVVNIAIDATPDDPSDGVSEWLHGYWYTDLKLGGFDPVTGDHIDVWKWTHIVEARPHNGEVAIYDWSQTPTVAGSLALNTGDGFIEFRVPLSALTGLDPEAGFRVWITVMALNPDNLNEFYNPPGANAIDVAGVGDTNAELLTSRDPDWANLVWPSEDIWVDQAFRISFSGPGTPSIPDPDPATPPTKVVIIYPQPGSTVNVSAIRQPLLAVVLVKGTQGRPVSLTIPGIGTFTGVVGADDAAVIAYTAPVANGTQQITVTSDGVSNTTMITYQLQFALPLPEPPIMPVVLLAALLLLATLRRRK